MNNVSRHGSYARICVDTESRLIDVASNSAFDSALLLPCLPSSCF